ncbi:hypothetical protein A3F66_03360 [candidate division TM6 bacterium RIFCSPHIGHO2_12_FULL_32_22]|nr:MAG: hypothetical protein A3F66_03360 [candidate division TM6 bacterium RIFCSPHIGHO2_12_FULL_32_22]
MKKSPFLLVLLFALPACFKKQPVVTTKPAPAVTDSGWEKTGPSVRFDDDVDEFFLEDDEEGNVFEQGISGNDQVLEMAELPLEQQDTEVIQFDFDRTKVKPSEKEKVARNVEHVKDVLNDNPQAVTVVDGHSCKIAKSQTYNYMISQERAENVAKEYVSKGVPESKVKALGHGSSELLTDADGKEAQAPNRRAETKFVKS